MIDSAPGCAIGLCAWRKTSKEAQEDPSRSVASVSSRRKTNRRPSEREALTVGQRSNERIYGRGARMWQCLV